MPNSNTNHREAADRLYDRGDHTAALKEYQALAQAGTDVAWAYNRIGVILAQMGERDEAEAALLKAIAANPNMAQAYSNLGNIAYERGQYPEAAAKYQQATQLDPSNPIFYENLHAAYKRMGKVRDAVASLKQARRVERSQASAGAQWQQTHTAIRRKIGCATSLLLITLLIVAMAVLTNS